MILQTNYDLINNDEEDESQIKHLTIIGFILLGILISIL